MPSHSRMAEGDFMLLRPLLIQLLEMPSKDTVEALTSGLREGDVSSLQFLQSYILLPLFELLNASLSKQQIAVDIVNCIKTVIMRTEINSWSTFSNLSFQLMRVISIPDKSFQSPIADVSDEIKQAVVSCFQESVTRCTTGVLQKMFSEQFVPRLGHVIYVLLHLSENEKARGTRLLAMNCLKRLGSCQEKSPEVRNEVLSCLATFVPGISVALTKVATESGLAGQTVIVTALQTWSELIFNIYDDRYLIWDEDEVETDRKNKGLTKTVRNKAWAKVSEDKLFLLISKVETLVGHTGWKVRFALAKWADTLLQKCKRSLAKCVPVGLSIVITLSADEYVQVSRLSEQALEKFGERLAGDERSLVETLQENLFGLALQLPSIFRNSSDALKLSTLDKLCGHLKVLGTLVNVLLNSKAHLEKLSFGLLYLSEMDCASVRLISEKSSNVDHENMLLMDSSVTHLTKAHRQFVHFNDERIFVKIANICQTLGRNGDLLLLVDHFLERFHESSTYKKQAVLLLNEIVLGAATRTSAEDGSTDLYNVIRMVVEDYLEPSIWNVPSSNDNVPASDFEDSKVKPRDLMVCQGMGAFDTPNTILALSSNTVLVCLMLEGIGASAQVLRSKMNRMLMVVLSNVLEKLGSTNALVSHTAYSTLAHISSCCGYNSISDVILRNADYLLNYLSVKLRYNPLDPNGPTILRMALQHSDGRMVEMAQDIVEEILTNLDTYHGTSVTMYLGVLHALVNSILKWFPCKKSSSKVVPLSVQETARRRLNSVCEFILEYDRLKKQSESMADDQVSDDQVSDEKDLGVRDGADEVEDEHEVIGADQGLVESQTKSKSPAFVQMTVKVLERCAHLLPSSSVSVALGVLNILDTSVQALQDWEDDLLPMVHKVWAPFVRRFDDDNILVVKAAFHTLCSMTKVCGDFLSSRIMKEVWPKVLSRLEEQSTVCKSKEATIYRHSQSFKLLLDVLSEIGHLAEMLKVPDLELDNLASVTVAYLSCLQPPPVQIAGVKLFEKLSSVNSDLIWLKLNDLSCQQSTLNVGLDGFPVLKIGGVYDGNAEFKENVIHLLRFMEESDM